MPRPPNFVVPERHRQLPKTSLPPPPSTYIPLEDQGSLQYEVEGIVGDKKENGRRLFRVKWKGYDHQDNSWEPEEDLEEAQVAVQQYLRTKRRLQQEKKTNDLSATARYPPFYPSLLTAVLPASVDKPVVVNGRADISLDDAIKGIVNLDTDGWIKIDELYERLALSFFKVKNWTKLSRAEKRSVQNKVRCAMQITFPAIGNTSRKGGRKDRCAVYCGLKFI